MLNIFLIIIVIFYDYYNREALRELYLSVLFAIFFKQ